MRQDHKISVFAVFVEESSYCGMVSFPGGFQSVFGRLNEMPQHPQLAKSLADKWVVLEDYGRHWVEEPIRVLSLRQEDLFLQRCGGTPQLRFEDLPQLPYKGGEFGFDRVFRFDLFVINFDE